jgi:hypothetical protein
MQGKLWVAIEETGSPAHLSHSLYGLLLLRILFLIFIDSLSNQG